MGCQMLLLKFIVGMIAVFVGLFIAVLIIVAIEGSKEEPIVDCGYAGMQKESVCRGWQERLGTPPRR